MTASTILQLSFISSIYFFSSVNFKVYFFYLAVSMDCKTFYINPCYQYSFMKSWLPSMME